MLSAENNRAVAGPSELEGEAVFVPYMEDEEFEQELLDRRATQGRVRWFSRSLGYGFVREDGCSSEVFVHQSSIQIPGVKDLRPGQRILFECCRTVRGGVIALNVLPIMERADALERYHKKRNAQGKGTGVGDSPKIG